MSTKLLRFARASIRSPYTLQQTSIARNFHTTPAKMSEDLVHKIQSVDGFKEALASNDVVFVDWFAEWCGPCKAIAPKIKDWANTNKSIYFAKIDVDGLPELSQEYGIRAMPTFMIFKNGEKVDEFIGANPGPLMQLIAKHRGEEKGEEEK